MTFDHPTRFGSVLVRSLRPTVSEDRYHVCVSKVCILPVCKSRDRGEDRHRLTLLQVPFARPMIGPSCDATRRCEHPSMVSAQVERPHGCLLLRERTIGALDAGHCWACLSANAKTPRQTNVAFPSISRSLYPPCLTIHARNRSMCPHWNFRTTGAHLTMIPSAFVSTPTVILFEER